MELLVPPLAIGNIPKISDVRETEVVESAPLVDLTIPVPKEEKVGADVTVKDPPIATLPVVESVVPEIAARSDDPDTLIPLLNTPTEVWTVDAPSPTLPVAVKVVSLVS